MTLILGIDPGSRITGYGVVRDTGRGCEYVASGCIRTGSGELSERLRAVFSGVSEVIRTYGPVTMGIEQVFMARNADSALKLGQARGAAIVAGAEAGLQIAEYTATQVKQAIAGTGGADIEDRPQEGTHHRLDAGPRCARDNLLERIDPQLVQGFGAQAQGRAQHRLLRTEVVVRRRHAGAGSLLSVQRDYRQALLHPENPPAEVDCGAAGARRTP